MAAEYDEKFEEITGMLRQMQKSIGGVDELRLDVRDLRLDIGGMRSEVGGLRLEVEELKTGVISNTSTLNTLIEKVNVLANQFNDIDVLALDDHKRIDNLEERVEILEVH